MAVTFTVPTNQRTIGVAALGSLVAILLLAHASGHVRYAVRRALMCFLHAHASRSFAALQLDLARWDERQCLGLVHATSGASAQSASLV